MKRFPVAIALIVLALLPLPGCRSNRYKSIKGDEAVERYHQYEKENDFDRMFALIDSCERAGVWPPEAVHMRRGFAYYMQWDVKACDEELRKGIEEGKKGVVDYNSFISCYMYLASDLRESGDYEGAMKTAGEALDYIDSWRKEGVETQLDETALLSLNLTIAQTQARKGKVEDARKTIDGLWEQMQPYLDNLPLEDYAYLFTDLCDGVLSAFFEAGSFEDVLQWTEKYDQVHARCSQYLSESAFDYSYMPMRLFYEIVALANTGQKRQAETLYEKLQEYPRDREPDFVIYNVRILRSLGRYQEAAALYESVLDGIEGADLKPDEAVHAYTVGYTLFRETGDAAKALVMADSLAARAEPALMSAREDNAAELAAIYDTKGKETQIALQQARLSRQRLIGAAIALVLLTAFFLIYSWFRRRAARRLGEAHVKLQEAYDQLEETTTAKERIESELRIARNIQMSMVPGLFPERDGLDMYAEMSPAKEVGGDLYGYVLQGNKLFFCVGDVSGKGVPASLFMAQSVRLFRTLAAEGLTPAGIATRMNNALAENNDQGMFVTMFLGLLHLDSGQLDYCNCGHNAPVLDGAFLEMQYTNLPLGLMEEMPFQGETLPDVRGRRLLVYTDGLNEAENAQQELFGNERLLGLMAGAGELDARQTIAMLKEAVEQHRAGADPNDDLTLLCLELSR